MTLWLGASLIFISIIAALTLNSMDDRAKREHAGPYAIVEKDPELLDDQAVAVTTDEEGGAPPKPKSKRVNLSDVRSFPLSYWVICLTNATFYNIVFPFMADAKSLLSDRCVRLRPWWLVERLALNLAPTPDPYTPDPRPPTPLTAEP